MADLGEERSTIEVLPIREPAPAPVPQREPVPA